jgi:hypothetical protein
VPDPVLFTDAAAAVASHLNTTLGVETGSRVPLPRPEEFYRVIRVGGVAREKVMDDATIVVEAWAPTDEEADDLAQLARAHLLAMVNVWVEGTLVYRVVDIAAPANLPDPISGVSRVTATYTVTTRCLSLETAS